MVSDAVPETAPLFLRGVQPELSGLTVLLVDDNATNRRILEHQAHAWGMTPLTACSGMEALEILKTQRCDLAILDMQMPEMDGEQLARAIRMNPDDEGTPIVLLTSLGHFSKDEKDELDDLFAAFLVKPIKPSQLFDTLIGVVDQQTVVPKKVEQPVEIDHAMGGRHPLQILLVEDNAVNQKVALGILGQARL